MSPAGAGVPPSGGLHLVVMARWPAPGRCKRRLAATIGRGAAATIQARLTRHTLAVAVEAAEKEADARLILAVDGLGPRAARRWGGSLGVSTVRLQGSGGLGLRMQRQVQHSFRSGARGVVLIGTDLPDLDAPALASAFGALAVHPLVLGPARDGGYWLLGLRAPCASAPLLVGIPWGSDRVLALTRRAAERLGLAALLLAERSDLDRLEDLSPWLT